MIDRASGLEELSQRAAEFCAQCAEEAIRARRRFTIALTGGSTPRRLYEILAAKPWAGRIEWSHWHVFWGDERMVPSDDEESNCHLAVSTLLRNVPVPSEQIHCIPTAQGSPAEVAEAYEGEIRRIFDLPLSANDWPRFDLVLLGLGADGHVASLFPGFPTLDETRRLVVWSPPGRLPPHVDRVTLTMPVLNAARAVVFLVSGAEKAPAVRGALTGDKSLPAARVQPTAGDLRWYVDAAALSQTPTDLRENE